MGKRILLFLATNLAILVLLGAVMSALQAAGFSIQGKGQLLVFAAVFGFGGAFISLFLSKPIAKWSTGARIITDPVGPREQWLVHTVRRQAGQAGIGMPEVAIYPGSEINAFATGWNRNNALVAVSQGLLDGMAQEEAEAVLAHEVSHIANGDMVTMTLLQGVLNTFVIFAARIVGGIVDRWLNGGEGGRGIGYFVTVIILEIAFGILASVIVAAFSRHREFRADAGSARLVGSGKMVAALRRLGQASGENTLPEAVRAFGINGGVMGLFRTHPPINARIAALTGN